MKPQTAICIGSASVAILVTAFLWIAPAGGQPKEKDGGGQALIKRGVYIVNEVARCGDCHSPRDNRGKLDMSRHLQGAKMWFRPTVRVGEFEDKAPNITATGKAGKWSEEKMVKFLSTGGRSDAPMPAYKLTEEDARAVTAYLRSLTGGGKDQKEKKRGRDKDDD